MVKRILALIMSSAMLLAAGCNNAGILAATPALPKSISFDDYEAQREVRQQNQVEEAYVQAANDFAARSAGKVFGEQQVNAAYSPISLFMALSLAGTGAAGETQEEIFAALGLSDWQSEHIAQQTGKLFRLLYSDNKIGKLLISNSLWMQEGIKFDQKFLEQAAEEFYASAHLVDFSQQKTAEKMEKWISEQTGGLIEPKIQTDPQQILSIINTLYFKDEWIDRFDEKKTEPDTFHKADGSQVECDFMNQTFGSHGFVRGKGYTSVSLSLKNNGSMTFILPDEGVSPEDLLKDPQKAAELFGNGGENVHSGFGEVVLQVPKFSYGSDFKLKETLQQLGIEKAFQGEADFSNMTSQDTFISSINQQTHVGIDEKGVEAAAFTEILYCGAAMPTDRAEVRLTRPFLYRITAAGGTLLFVGAVYDPTAQ